MRRRRLLSPADRVLVALSAGPDSTALLAALAALRDAGHLAAVAALHVDHGLRAGAEEDAACAAAACARLGVPLACVKVVVGPGNVQAAARRARYAALLREAARVGATRIATGHTRTDQAETVLLRLLRGSGARGLGGIPPRRGPLVRPLLDRSRAEGIRFLEGLGLAWRDDPSNATPRYARNRLRLTLWPELLRLAPTAERVLARTADLAREDERALAARARAVVGTSTRVERASLAAAPAAVRRRMVRRLWRNATGRSAGLEARHVEAILGLIRGSRPRRVALPGGLEGRCGYGRVEIGPPRRGGATAGPVSVAGPGTYEVPPVGAVVVAAARADLVPWPLTLRTRHPGDRLRPEGGRGSRSLKRWLIDRKVPREERDSLLLLTSEQRVLAIPALAVVAEGLGAPGAGLEVRLLNRG